MYKTEKLGMGLGMGLRILVCEYIIKFIPYRKSHHLLVIKFWPALKCVYYAEYYRSFPQQGVKEC